VGAHDGLPRLCRHVRSLICDSIYICNLTVHFSDLDDVMCGLGALIQPTGDEYLSLNRIIIRLFTIAVQHGPVLSGLPLESTEYCETNLLILERWRTLDGVMLVHRAGPILAEIVFYFLLVSVMAG
jgi:hypothetical protein